MKVSLHRRRHQSLPPQRARSPKLVIVLVGLTAATVAFAATRGESAVPTEPTFDPAVSAAEHASRAVVDERVRAHLRRLR